MAIPITVFLAQVDGLVEADNDIILQLTRYRLIKAAVEQYSADRPDTETDDVAGDGGKYYPVVTSLSEWEEEFSFIKTIEYPAIAIADDETPVYLEPEDWQEDYWQGDIRYLWLPHHTPAVTETMRILYTVPYGWSASLTVTTAVAQSSHGFSVNDYVYLLASDSTWYEADDAAIATHQVSAAADTDNFTAAALETGVPPANFFAICDLAACLVCQAMAAKFAKASESTIRADSVRHISKSQEYAKRATEYCAKYQRHMGLGEFADAVEASGTFVDWDTSPDWPAGRRYLTHNEDVR